MITGCHDRLATDAVPSASEHPYKVPKIPELLPLHQETRCRVVLQKPAAHRSVWTCQAGCLLHAPSRGGSTGSGLGPVTQGKSTETGGVLLKKMLKAPAKGDLPLPSKSHGKSLCHGTQEQVQVLMLQEKAGQPRI